MDRDAHRDRMLPVLRAMAVEAEYQDNKWGEDKNQSLEGFLLIAQRELQEAVDGWMKNKTGRDACIHELIQVATVCARAVSEHATSYMDYAPKHEDFEYIAHGAPGAKAYAGPSQGVPRLEP